MNRLNSTFAHLRQQQQKALLGFITAGDGGFKTTVSIMHELVEAGVNIIELGMPFSDPMADGKSIQLSSARALKAGTKLKDVMAMVTEFRRQNQHTPVVLMGYLNPIFNRGLQQFARDCHQVGVDAIICVDLPPEEATELKEALNFFNIDLIFLIAPTTTKARIAHICQMASGFIYYVAIKGVTGSQSASVEDVKAHIGTIKAHTDLPVVVGFGIKDPQSAHDMAQSSDGVVVGSAIVDLIAAHPDDVATSCAKVGVFATSLRQGLNQGQ